MIEERNGRFYIAGTTKWFGTRDRALAHIQKHGVPALAANEDYDPENPEYDREAQAARYDEDDDPERPRDEPEPEYEWEGAEAYGGPRRLPARDATPRQSRGRRGR